MVQRAAAHASASFQHQHIPAGPRQDPGRRQPRQAGADHDNLSSPRLARPLRKRRGCTAETDDTGACGGSPDGFAPCQPVLRRPVAHCISLILILLSSSVAHTT
jgi:hypothetical protein